MTMVRHPGRDGERSEPALSGIHSVTLSLPSTGYGVHLSALAEWIPDRCRRSRACLSGMTKERYPLPFPPILRNHRAREEPP